MSKAEAVLFDLDQTLVDSDSLESLRRARDWKKVYARIGEVKAHDGIRELFSRIRESQVGLAIVTSSPRPYCERVLKQCNLTANVIVCYHDTKLHKPHPAPLLLAMEKLGITPGHGVIGVGDTETDVVAAKSAGVIAVAVTWGIKDAFALSKCEPHYLIRSVDKLSDLIFGAEAK